jgi:4a-hydroxytetrahydrobiopterin dehydratase
MSHALNDNQRDEALKKLPLWRLSEDGKALERIIRFGNFSLAFSFMTVIALKAEKIDHHPEWSNVYNRVSIRLTTHSCESLSMLDIELAHYIDLVEKRFLK